MQPLGEAELTRRSPHQRKRGLAEQRFGGGIELDEPILLVDHEHPELQTRQQLRQQRVGLPAVPLLAAEVRRQGVELPCDLALRAAAATDPQAVIAGAQSVQETRQQLQGTGAAPGRQREPAREPEQGEPHCPPERRRCEPNTRGGQQCQRQQRQYRQCGKTRVAPAPRVAEPHSRSFSSRRYSALRLTPSFAAAAATSPPQLSIARRTT